MPRVIVSCSNNRPWSIGQYLETAVRDIGHDAVLFNYRDLADPDGDVLRLCDSHRAEYHIGYKCETFRPETIREMKRRGIFTALWHPDPDIPGWLVPLAREQDMFITMANGLVKDYEAQGIPCVRWLSEGLEPSAYKYDSITDEERRRYSADVVLIGNIANSPNYRERWKLLQRLVREGFDVKWWGTHIARKPRNWRMLLSRVNRAWGGTNVWNETYAKAVACSKIFVARDVRPWIDKSLSNRAYYATGNGVFYLTHYTQGIEDIFEIGREIDVFHDHSEMVSKVRYYLEYEDERRAIAAAGRKRTLENYTYQHRFAEMFRMFDEVRRERGTP